MLRVPLLIFVISGLFQSISLPAQTRYQGLLWEISGKGTTRPSYLYGTMHVPEKLAFNLSDSFFVAIKSVEMVSLETNHDIWQDFMQQMREDSKNYFTQYSGNRSQYFDESSYINLYNSAFLFEAPEANYFESMLAYRPVMANEFLYRSNTYAEDFEEDTYLDLFIFQTGKKLGKKVIGLESMEGSYESVTRSRIPPEDEEEMQEYGRKYIPPNAIRDAYRRQDLSALDSLNNMMSPGKNFKKHMLDVRNEVMANGIDSIAQMGKTMFSAVGAAHLPGELGVIELLRKKGYTVRAVSFSFDTEKKEMKEIEKLRFPVQLSTQWSPDSAWSVDAPTKFYSTAENARISQSLSADMSNGAYYAVYEIQTFGRWTGQSPDFIAERIDSIIYEKVPGKIQERTRINSPYPGHDITTLTRRGDIQRYKVLITPYSVYMFMAGGNGDYVSGPEGEQFFKSIRLNPKRFKPVSEVTTVSPEHGGFEVTFPTVPAVNNADDPDAKSIYIAAEGSDQSWYFLGKDDYHDYNFIEEDTFELNIIAEKIAEKHTKSAPEMATNSLTPYPDLEFSFRGDRDSAWYFGRIVIDGPSYYLIGARNTTGKRPAEFLNSFRIAPKEWPEGWKLHTDTNAHFTVQMPDIPEKTISPFFLRLQEINKEIAEKNNKRYESGANYEDRFYRNNNNRSGNLSSPLTGEQVAFERSAIQLEDYPDRDSLQRSIQQRINYNQSLYLEDATFRQEGDSLIIFEHIFSDTNSNRGIRQKFWITSKSMYSLSATINRDVPNSTFIDTVFSSFQPTDTSLSAPVKFGASSLRFLQNIYATDSLVKAGALDELNKFFLPRLKPADFTVVRQTIENPEFDRLNLYDKGRLIRAVGATKSKEALPWLLRFYKEHSDSLHYQELATRSMIILRSKEAYSAILKTMLTQPGYDSDGTNYAFWGLTDSLALAKKFVPELLQLTRQPEHKLSALTLLQNLLQKNMIKPKAVKSLVPELLHQLQYALNNIRYQEETERGQKKNSYSYSSYRPSSSLGSDQGGISKIAREILIYFYDDNPQVRSTFADMLKYGSDTDKTNTIGVLLHAGKTVPESLLTELASKDVSRFILYRTLFTVGKEMAYSALFSDHLSLVQSYIIGNNFSDKEEGDSIRFISKHATKYNNKPANLYFYEYKRKKEKDWSLVYVTLPDDFGLNHEKDENQVIYPPYNTNEYYSPDYDSQVYSSISVREFNSESEKKDFIHKMVAELRFEGRMRYKKPYDEYGYGY